MAISKKAQTAKDAAEASKSTKVQAAGFVNHALLLPNGTTYKAPATEKNPNNGFAISGDPKWRSPQEDYYLDLARQNGGSITVTLKCTIRAFGNDIVPVAPPTLADIFS